MWVDNVWNGKPVIRFSGDNVLDDVLDAGDNYDIGTNSRTVFLVAKANNNDYAFYAKSNAVGGDNRFMFWKRASQPSPAFVLVDVQGFFNYWGSNPTDVSMWVNMIDRTAQETRLYRNSLVGGGTQVGIAGPAYNFTSSNRFLIGAYNAEPDPGELLHLNGDIAEMIMYDRALTNQERNSVEHYLQVKYAQPFSLGPDTVTYSLCNLPLNAVAGFTNYQWSTGQTTTGISVNRSGNYWVSAIDANGLAVSDTIKVTFAAKADWQDTILCASPGLVIGRGLPPSYTYAWSTGANTPTIGINSEGEYRVTITDLGACVYADTFTVQLDSLFYQVGFSSGNVDLCSGNFISLQNGNQLVESYLWSTSDTTPVTTVFISGIYSVTVSDSNGCTAADTIVVNILGVAPDADFGFDIACQGFATNFSDSSKSSTATVDSFLWDFGGGQTGTGPNPSFTFNNYGSFNVTLTAGTDQGCYSTVTKSVTVIQNPVAYFSLPPAACLNYPFAFNSTNVAGAGDSIISYYWSFGDGDTSTLQNPSHTYSLIGPKPVSLTVTTLNGCLATYTDTLLVDTVVLVADSVSLHQPPYGYITASGSINFSWFQSENAATYTLQIATDNSFGNLIHSIPVIGTNYTLTLAPENYYWRVLAGNSCGQLTNSEVRYLSVLNLSSLGSLPLWLKADGGVSKDANNFVSGWLNELGGPNFGQLNTSKQPVWVDSVWNDKPVIRFSGDDVLDAGDNYDLGTNSRTLFLVSKANNDNYAYYAKSNAIGGDNRFTFWYRGNPAVGPSYLAVDNASAYFNNWGSNPAGTGIWVNLLDRASQETKVYRNSTIGAGTQSGIAGASYNFSSTYRFLIGAYNDEVDTGEVLHLNGDIAEMIIYDNALADSARNRVEQYLRFKYAPQINLGPDIYLKYGVCDTALRAGPFFSDFLWSTGETGDNIAVVASGTYWVTAKDIFGYTTTDTIVIHSAYNGTNVGNTAIVCIGDSVQIIQQISNPEAYTFLWQDGSTSNSLFASVKGNYYATITDTLGCSFTSRPVFVDIDSFKLFSLLPVADTAVCNGNDIAVYPYKYPYTSFEWTTPATTSVLPQVAVDSSGNYTVRVTDINSCVATDTIYVTRSWYAPLTDFTFNRVCDGTAAVFQNQTNMVSQDSVRVWSWNFGDNNIDSIASPSHLYVSTGTYKVVLSLVTDSGCTGYKTDTVNVYPQPQAAYSYSPQIICAGVDIKFSDLTPTPLPDSIARFWLFNNTNSFTDSTFNYTFSSAGAVPFLFIVTTNHDCADTISRTFQVNPELIADFSFTKVCLGDTTKFIDISPSGSIISRQWRFGDASQLTGLRNPLHKYQVADTFFVKLTITDSIGCIDTVNKAVKIASIPEASFTDQNACEGFFYKPLDGSTFQNDSINQWFWNIDDSVYTTQAPQHFFALAGSYPAKLKVTSQSGCVDSTSRVVTIYPNPVALFTFTPLYGESPLEVSFNNISTDAATYLWNFGDATPTSTEEYPSHVYNQNGDYTITLGVVSPQGCTDSFNQRLIIAPTSLDLSVDKVETQSVVQSDGSVHVTVTVSMTNVGTRIVTSAKLYALLGGGGFIAEDWTDSMPGGTYREYTFRAQFVTLSNSENSYVCVEARDVNAGEPEARYDNNRQCATLTGNIQLVGPSPNPASDRSVLGIILPKAGKVNVAIANTLGQYVLEETELSLPAGRSDFEIPAHRMSAAEYFIRVTYNDEKMVRKFVLKR